MCWVTVFHENERYFWFYMKIILREIDQLVIFLSNSQALSGITLHAIFLVRFRLSWGGEPVHMFWVISSNYIFFISSRFPLLDCITYCSLEFILLFIYVFHLLNHTISLWDSGTLCPVFILYFHLKVNWVLLFRIMALSWNNW